MAETCLAANPTTGALDAVGRGTPFPSFERYN